MSVCTKLKLLLVLDGIEKNQGPYPIILSVDQRTLILICIDEEISVPLQINGFSNHLQEVIIPAVCQFHTPSTCCPVPILLIPDCNVESVVDHIKTQRYCNIHILLKVSTAAVNSSSLLSAL